MLDNIKNMAIFAQLVEHGSFSITANALGISTSAVSQNIKSLEKELDITLIDRATRKLVLTDAGYSFYHVCKEIILTINRGKIFISNHHDKKIEELHIATVSELSSIHIVPALSHWLATHPNIKTYFHTCEPNQLILPECVDITIAIDPQLTDPSLDITPLTTLDQVIVASPHYLQYNTPIFSPENLIFHKMIINHLASSASAHEIALSHQKSGQHLSIKIPAYMHSNDVYTAKALCLAGHGIAQMKYADVHHELASGALIKVLPHWQIKTNTIYAITSSDITIKKSITTSCVNAINHYFSMLSAVDRLSTK